jgi:tetratricopeptide (TPR) repeat protein
MKMVNCALAAIFLATGACSGQTVPEKDTILESLNDGDLAAARIQIKSALTANPGDPELHFLNARIALETGNAELAKSELKPLLQNAKFAQQAKTLLGQAFLMLGNPQMALDTLGAEPYDSGTAFAVAVDAHTSLGHVDLASGLLAKGLTTFPNSSDLLQVDAQAAIAQGDMARAQASSAKAISVAPHDIHAMVLAGRLALLDGNAAEAEKFFDQALKRNGGERTALLAKAAIAHDRGDRAATEKLLATAANSGTTGSPVALAFMAQMTIEVGNFDKANQILQALPAEFSPPYVAMLRGIVAGARGQNEQAISFLKPFLDQGSENPAARLALSNAFSATGDKRQAWNTLKPLADAANANAKVLDLAGQLTSALNLPEAAGYRARQQAAMQPDPLAKDMTAADRAISSGDWKAADAIYQRLLQQAPATTNVVLLNNAANARLRMGDMAAAVGIARQALAAAPNDPIVNDTLGWCLFKQAGATPEVVTLMRKAYAAQPGNAEIRDHLKQIAQTLKPIS